MTDDCTHPPEGLRRVADRFSTYECLTCDKTLKARELGLNPRSLRQNERARKRNPRALGTNPRARRQRKRAAVAR